MMLLLSYKHIKMTSPVVHHSFQETHELQRCLNISAIRQPYKNFGNYQMCPSWKSSRSLRVGSRNIHLFEISKTVKLSDGKTLGECNGLTDGVIDKIQS